MSWQANLEGDQTSYIDQTEISSKQVENLIGFRREDVNVLREMSTFEANAGNATGAALLDSIANKLDTIMQRSSSRMTAVVLDAPARAPGSEEANMWPFRSASLRSNGRDLWKTAGDDAPHSSARMLESFDGADGGASWTVRVNQLSGPAAFGLTTLDVGLDADWCTPAHRGQVPPRIPRSRGPPAPKRTRKARACRGRRRAAALTARPGAPPPAANRSQRAKFSAPQPLAPGPAPTPSLRSPPLAPPPRRRRRRPASPPRPPPPPRRPST